MKNARSFNSNHLSSHVKIIAVISVVTAIALAPLLSVATEKNLKRQNYRVKHHETLGRIAKLVYGQTDDWQKLKDENLKVVGEIGPDSELTPGLTLTYLAPKIGNTYIVEKGDFLIRIATWKYGDSAMWETLYQNNADRIENPNLIHPGDQLTFLENGKVKNDTTGQTILNGTDGNRNPASASAAQQDPIAAWNQSFKAPANPLVYAPPEGTPGVLKRLTPIEAMWDEIKREGIFQNLYFWVGFVSALFLFLVLPINWLIARSRRQKFTDEDGVVRFRNADENQNPHGQGDDTDEYEYEDESLRGQLHSFKKRPVEEYKIDKSLIHYEDGEVSKLPGYHSLVPTKLRKYLKRKGKSRNAA